MENRQNIIDFIEDNQEKFYRIAFSYAKNREDALDIVHDTIVKALQKQYTLRRREYLQTWFYRILINESISFLRKNKKTVLIDDFEPFETSSENDDFDQTEYMDLYHAIEKLPVKLKTIVLLRFFEDMKLEEIADITSANLSTTKSRLYKALKLLKLDLEGFEYD